MLPSHGPALAYKRIGSPSAVTVTGVVMLFNCCDVDVDDDDGGDDYVVMMMMT